VVGHVTHVDLAHVPVDQYVRKPAGRADIEGVVETHRGKQEYLRAVDEYFAAAAKLGAIEADGRVGRYEELRRRVAKKRATVDRLLSDFGPDWTVAFGSVPAPAGGHDGSGVRHSEGHRDEHERDARRRRTRA